VAWSSPTGRPPAVDGRWQQVTRAESRLQPSPDVVVGGIPMVDKKINTPLANLGQQTHPVSPDGHLTHFGMGT
jgi:hypothetical protein